MRRWSGISNLKKSLVSLVFFVAMASFSATAQSTPARLPASTVWADANAIHPVTSAAGHLSTGFPLIVPRNRRSIGLSLEGGGALGLAHIGVLFWFEQNRIPVDRIAGTSMGALLGSLYASGYTPEEMQKLATSDVFTEIFECFE